MNGGFFSSIEGLEETLSEKCIELLEETGLFILCAAFNAHAQ